MSNSPNKMMDTDSAVQNVQSNKPAAESNASNSSEKRLAPEAVDDQIKKMKIETPMLEGKVLMRSEASAAAPKFVSASTMIEPAQEISDEELLQFTLEFERTYGIK